jgi:hypothetical protein
MVLLTLALCSFNFGLGHDNTWAEEESLLEAYIPITGKIYILEICVCEDRTDSSAAVLG